MDTLGFLFLVLFLVVSCHFSDGVITNNCFAPTTSTEKCNSKYRSLDGTCNNPTLPSLGKYNSCYNRLLFPEYADNKSLPRGQLLNADGSAPKELLTGSLPYPRQISITINTDKNVPDKKFSHFGMAFGQLIAHDISLASAEDDTKNACCVGCDRKDCTTIEYSTTDPFFSQFNTTEISLSRIKACSDSCTPGVRQPTNSVTSAIDLSIVYGTDEDTIKRARKFVNGELIMQKQSGGDLLGPRAEVERDSAIELCINNVKENQACFDSGDRRVNQQPGLTSLQTLFARQHNKIASLYSQANPTANDEEIFQEARRILIAQYQMIIYAEYLPALVGYSAMENNQLSVFKSGYTKYNSSVDLTAIAEFTFAAFRFGHSQIQNEFLKISDDNVKNSQPLMDSYFCPFSFYKGSFNSFVRGLFSQESQTTDRFMVTGITEFLFRIGDMSFGNDLIAIDITRTRDIGFPGYIDYLKLLGYGVINSFDDLQKLGLITLDKIELLKKVYRTVDEIDMYTAGFLETPDVTDSPLGPTFRYIVTTMFYNSKFGDRFYFENGGEIGSFTPTQLDEIRKTTLAQILCSNSPGIESVPKYVLLNSVDSDHVYCEDFKEINLAYW